ncbi:MAG: glyoxylate/hydroxypyruvate reductase A [Pseudomonadota bacterium]
MTRLIDIRVAEDETDAWREGLLAGMAGRGLSIAGPEVPKSDIDYLVYNIDSGLMDFADYTGLRAIFNTWAGLEQVLGRVTWPDHVPFCRMVEPGLTEGMVEYFLAHVLRYHMEVDTFQANSAAGIWDKLEPPLARDRTVGILGLGALGQATAEALVPLRFKVCGWSRSPKDIAGVTCFHGADGLAETLKRSEILVVILPQTAATIHILNAETLALMPKGARIINAGRGPLIDDDALLDALASGQIGHATLDVFSTEPLPSDRAFWGHPSVTVTPHIAAVTRAGSASQAILQQIDRHMAGEPLLHIVDSARGY